VTFLGTNIRTNEEVAIKLVSALIPGQCLNFKRSWDNFTALFRAFKFAQFTSIINFNPSHKKTKLNFSLGTSAY
jgi:hypothetical protein